MWRLLDANGDGVADACELADLTEWATGDMDAEGTPALPYRFVVGRVLA